MISIMVAMSKNKVIGKNNDLPWRLPEDLKYFKKVTTGHPIIMGRKTHDSIGRVLPGRENVVVTRDESYQKDGLTILHTLEEAISHFEDQHAFVIGGADIIRQMIQKADRLYLTFIDHEFEGDVFLESFDEKDWTLVSEEKGFKDEKNPYDYYFRVYENKNKA